MPEAVRVVCFYGLSFVLGSIACWMGLREYLQWQLMESLRVERKLFDEGYREGYHDGLTARERAERGGNKNEPG